MRRKAENLKAGFCLFFSYFDTKFENKMDDGIKNDNNPTIR
ncbi:hypothetical protein STRDD10_00783 [Streptococcus sp. DD10]|nr:hypothetical protein STRDD10_00783 [Streptococcus sp. DD10]